MTLEATGPAPALVKLAAGRVEADPEPGDVDGGLPSVRLARLARDAAAGPVGEDTGIDRLPPDVVEQLSRVVDASLAPASRRAYRADWDRFTGWATEQGYPVLPAPAAVVAAYVTAAAAQQHPNGSFVYAPATVTRWVSSINQVHTAAGLEGRAGRSWCAGRCPGSAGSARRRRRGGPLCCWPTSAAWSTGWS